jgi:hypothetical protein
MARRRLEMLFAAAGLIPSPKEEAEVTAVPANSTPIAPCPVVELYLSVGRCGSVSLTFYAKHSKSHVVVSFGPRTRLEMTKPS